LIGFVIIRSDTGDVYMSSTLPLSEADKLSLLYRVEPGCLGPTGDSLVDEFCVFAREKLQSLNSDYLACQFIARRDKTSPEMQYNIGDKKLNHAQAEKYLALFDANLNEFEDDLNDALTSLINEFMGH
jgi:hypothetical protein